MEDEIDHILFSPEIRVVPKITRLGCKKSHAIFYSAIVKVRAQNLPQVFSISKIKFPNSYAMIICIENGVEWQKLAVIYNRARKISDLNYIYCTFRYPDTASLHGYGKTKRDGFLLEVKITLWKLLNTYRMLEYFGKYFFADIDGDRFDKIKLMK